MSTPFSEFFMKINKISPQEHDFTSQLTAIALKPKMLYYYGTLPENVGLKRSPAVAIVGARKNTSYGEKIAYRAAYEAAKRGAVVVSGLAYGIDSIAHRGALDAGGVTVAVLGTPIDKIYPTAHQGLAREIIERGGAVISEIPSGVKYGEAVEYGDKMDDYYTRTSFLYRNRLISGLSDVVMVVEARERSGSLNTAAHALEQGKELMVVPGDINRATSVGCNKLINQGALVYAGVEDLLEVLFPAASKKEVRQLRLPIGDSPVENAILKALGQGVSDGEEIVKVVGLDVSEFNQAVTLMEIKGYIRALGGNRWMVK